MVRFINDRLERIPVRDSDAEILMRNSPKFNGYFRDTAFQGSPSIEAHAAMIIYDNTRKHSDLIFTTDGLIDVHSGKAKYLTSYNEVGLRNGDLVLYSGKYKHKSVDGVALADLIHELSVKFPKNLEDRVEYIPNILSAPILLDWFRQHEDAMTDNAIRVLATPTLEILERYGYITRTPLDTNKNILQLYLNRDTRDVMGMRIVRGEGINSELQSMLLEHGGELRIGK